MEIVAVVIVIVLGGSPYEHAIVKTLADCRSTKELILEANEQLEDDQVLCLPLPKGATRRSL